MRCSRVFASIVFLLAAFSSVVLLPTGASAEIKLRVVDPQDAAVAGAEVQLLKLGKPVAVQNTSAEGLVVFREAASGAYRVNVLAPGFAAETLTVDVSPTAAAEVVTIKLRVATAAETVVVTATRTPVPSQAAGADVDSLSGGQLEGMQPVAANDTMRFLPGAVVNTAGQRGGISSLFVRGGESTYNKVIVDGVAVDNPGETFDFGTLPLAQADRLEFVRGAQSTLYGSDAMTSVVQVWTRTGSTPDSRTPLRRRWRKFRNRQRLRVFGGRPRALRLQLLWRPVQHQRAGRKRRLTRIRCRARMSAWQLPIRLDCESVSATPTAIPVYRGSGTSMATTRR